MFIGIIGVFWYQNDDGRASVRETTKQRNMVIDDEFMFLSHLDVVVLFYLCC